MNTYKFIFLFSLLYSIKAFPNCLVIDYVENKSIHTGYWENTDKLHYEKAQVYIENQYKIELCDNSKINHVTFSDRNEIHFLERDVVLNNSTGKWPQFFSCAENHEYFDYSRCQKYGIKIINLKTKPKLEFVL